MEKSDLLAELQAEVEARDSRVAALEAELQARCREVAELRQKLEIRNLSLERLQAQFTLAAEAVNKLLIEREKVRESRWGRWGMALGFLPKLKDDLG